MCPVTRDLLQLHRLTYGEPGLAKKLIKHYGSPEATLKYFDARLTPVRPAVSQRLSEAFKQQPKELHQYESWQALPDHFVLTMGDSNYPEQLAEIADPPLVLFGLGNASCLQQDQLSIVGSRKASKTGIILGEQFASELSAVGFVVTSGLALGVDAAAHRGALKVGGQTVAVEAVGAGDVYPRRHERLAAQIKDAGCLLTEYPSGVEARPYHFPQRNRIVTGLSRGTLVVEAAESSGSVISARLAMEQGREVFAVPGSAISSRNEGCHRLIRQGAKLVANLADLLEEFSDFEVKRHVRPRKLSDQEQVIVDVLASHPAHADRIHEVTGIAIHELMALLISLEIQGEIKSDGVGYRLSNLV